MLFVGLIFWSCEEQLKDELPEDCAGVAGGDNICGCTDSTASNYDSDATYDDGSCLLPIEITYNIHESLPSDWVTEFYAIMDNLLIIIPSYENVFDHINIYAWNDKVEDPYPGISGGAYVGGSPSDKIMVLEIPENEFIYQSMHRYSVVAHEYFHFYQLSINKPMNLPNGNYDPDGFSIKWLLEGTAASFESIYIQEYYNHNYFINAQNNINEMVHTDPSIFESYINNEINYGSSVFIILALAKELLGIIRSKYGTIPIPNSEVSLDGDTLRAEAAAEKEQLIEQLRENLEQTSRKALLEAQRDESESQQETLRKVPYPLYIG